MTSPAAASISNRLTTAQSLLLERSRVLSLGLVPSSSATHSLVRTLSGVKTELEQLQGRVTLESKGLVVGGGSGKKKRDNNGSEEELASVHVLGERYDRLIEMLAEDDVGRERARTLARETSVSPEIDPVTPEDQVVPDLMVEPPTPAPGDPPRPFRDYDEDEEDGERDDDGSDVTPHDMLSNQQLMMDDQDERLTLLSHSINRQNHLSVQIGSELDLHHELLEDTDAAMDRTAARLGRAKRHLDTVADNAKQYASTITIVVLILVLLLLIIVFKT